MPTAVTVLIAGGIGALSRWYVDGLFSRRDHTFPLGIFVVNVSGALAAGFVSAVLGERFDAPLWVRTAILTGFLGGYTTFSTLSNESVRLFQDGLPGLGLLNAFGSLGAGLLAAYVGILLGRLV
ncbi:MAG: CrcB family protein [Gaiellales bacterium]